MVNTNATNFRKNMFEYLDSALRLGSVININTKEGNAVVMSEEDYNQHRLVYTVDRESQTIHILSMWTYYEY